MADDACKSCKKGRAGTGSGQKPAVLSYSYLLLLQVTGNIGEFVIIPVLITALEFCYDHRYLKIVMSSNHSFV